ncbi:hypothetical protein AGLY_002450 [Aphis glycines]|uniref:Uncharacterized protein n=1 Tax=Aphis glycines TaxID=307491 RepID=A0A6G0U1N9_APHGL|nr:hypothetical protein AGLY_002450 [Aphis glycines]
MSYRTPAKRPVAAIRSSRSHAVRLLSTAMPTNRHWSAKSATAVRTSIATLSGTPSRNGISAYPQPTGAPSQTPAVAADDDANGVYAVTLWPPVAIAVTTARMNVQWLRAGNGSMASTLTAAVVGAETAHSTTNAAQAAAAAEAHCSAVTRRMSCLITPTWRYYSKMFMTYNAEFRDSDGLEGFFYLLKSFLFLPGFIYICICDRIFLTGFSDESCRRRFSTNDNRYYEHRYESLNFGLAALRGRLTETDGVVSHIAAVAAGHDHAPKVHVVIAEDAHYSLTDNQLERITTVHRSRSVDCSSMLIYFLRTNTRLVRS